MNDEILSNEASGTGKAVTAAVLVIGDEILSGRTKDANLTMIALHLNSLGIEVVEARVVRDVEERIVAAVNTLRSTYDYVFTTGGIGPTHDDITAESVARAFGVPIDYDPRALAILGAHYPSGEFTDARKRMARIPEGADLIENPVSAAPGFQLENVFVLAGIPIVAKAMIEGIDDRLKGGRPFETRTVRAYLAESQVAAALGAVQDRFPKVRIGSYPFYKDGRVGASLVLRGRDAAELSAAVQAVVEAVEELGVEALENVPES